METAEIQEEVLSTMYTVDEALDLLTPKVSGTVLIDENTSVDLDLPYKWELDLDSLDDEDMVSGTALSIGGKEYAISKAALLDLTSRFHISKKYVSLVPPYLLKPHMSYWLSQNQNSMRFLFNADKEIIALSKSPAGMLLSAQEVMEQTLNCLYQLTGAYPSDLHVDYKLTHDAKRTDFRIVYPFQGKVIHSVRDGVKEDLWHYGLSISMSESGLFPTSVEGYMFAWWCTNGAISTHASSGKFDRRSHEDDPEEFMVWFGNQAADTLLDMPNELESVQALTSIDLKGEMSDAAGEVFKRYKVPTVARESVLNALVESDDWSAYGLMNAVTQAANPSDTDERIRGLLFRAAGDMSAAFSERCTTCHRL